MRKVNTDRTVVFMSDGITWDTVLGCTVATLAVEGLKHIQSGNSIDTLDHDAIVSEITVKDLIRCWHEYHNI
jgi:hypothetical protein